MTPDEQADVLARWLAEPGSRPPAGLDPDVVEAVYALRPDLAPAPTLDLDALLDGLTVGPLASPEARAAAPAGPPAEVVAFPTASAGGPAADRAPRAGRPAWSRWVALAGGTSSLGLLAAAALVLVFVALPTSRELQLGAEPPAATESAAARSAPQAAPPPPVGDAVADAPPPLAAARAAGAPPPPPPPPPGVPDVPAVPATDMASADAVVRQRSAIPELRSAIPELEEAVAPLDEGGVAGGVVGGVAADEPAAAGDPYGGEAVADLEFDDALVADDPTDEDARRKDKRAEKLELPKEEAGPPAAAAPVAASEPARAPAQKATRPPDEASGDERASAVPRDLSGQGWRRGLDPATAQPFEAALAEADGLRRAGDPASAAARLAAAVAPPARAGQRMAADAARDWLSAGDPARAESVARQGLALSGTNSPERSQLLLLLGDALAARGDAAGAAQAWAEAAGLNAAR